MISKPWVALVIGTALSMAACKQKVQPDTAAAGAERITVAAAPTSSPTHQATPDSANSAHPALVDAAGFDIARVQIRSTPLPPFPYLDWPSSLDAKNSGREKNEEFDRAYVLAGEKLRAVEGRVSRRSFDNDKAKLSRVAAERNYENALRALGATKINSIESGTPQYESFESTSEFRKLDIYHGATYGAYLIRTPDKNVWFNVAINGATTKIEVIDEQAMKQSVGVMTPPMPVTVQ